MYKITGAVIKGQQRGKQLGFPTANVATDSPIPEGIYVSTTVYNGKEYQSITFIGAAKTFNETNFQSETFIFDFDKDIYGENLSITLLEKLRENKKFTSADELVKQMKDDTMKAREYFKVQRAKILKPFGLAQGGRVKDDILK
ncbi:MAG: riboflavin kinase [Candidatus Levybacteria bacterium]|nr:riboflavin kinase [Candidatus Levybacteria bacterium]